jgi:hypothetical protein
LLTDEGVVGEEPRVIQLGESLALYKSFNIL